MATERAEEQQREMLSALQRIIADRQIFMEFLDETRKLLQSLARADSDTVVQLRDLHTLKGNAAVFGLTSIARQAHELERRLLEEKRRINDDERAELQAKWLEIELRLRPLLGETDGRIQLSLPEYEEALGAIAKQEPYPALASRLRVWAHEPTRKRLALFADQARFLAKRLEKTEPSVHVEDGGLRLPREGLSAFWSTFVHVVRNAVDHGLESPQERRAAGKSEHGLVTLSTRLEKSMVAIRVADDGRGIDWSQVSEKARAKGLPTETHHDLEEAIFSDGVSTRDEATETSGRGVGLSAVRAVVSEMAARYSNGAGPRNGVHVPVPAAEAATVVLSGNRAGGSRRDLKSQCGYQTPASVTWAPCPSSLGAAPTSQRRADWRLAGAVTMETTPCVVSAAVHRP